MWDFGVGDGVGWERGFDVFVGFVLGYMYDVGEVCVCDSLVFSWFV